jgi:hypothetical protein
VILEVGEYVAAIKPKATLYESEPAKCLLQPSFFEEDFHLVEHAMAMLESATGNVEHFIVQVLDFSDATILKELSVDIDYFLYFLTCHMILG